jgi:hypothetical protein
LQALTGHVSTEDFEVLPARGGQCRGDRTWESTTSMTCGRATRSSTRPSRRRTG